MDSTIFLIKGIYFINRLIMNLGIIVKIDEFENSLISESVMNPIDIISTILIKL